MTLFEVCIKRSAQKDIQKLDKKTVLKIIKTIEALSIDICPSNVVKLRGTDTFYRIRVGDYRIIYELNKQESKIIIFYIRHRSKAYRQI